MGVPKTIRDAIVVAWLNGVVPLYRSPMWLVASSIVPVGILVLLSVHGGEQGFLWGVVGGLVWTIASSGVSLIGDAAFYRLEIRFQQMLTAAPVSPLGYALGLSLSALIYVSPMLAIYTALLVARGVLNLGNSLAVTVAVTLLWIATSALGFVASLKVRDMRYSWPSAMVLSVLFSTLSPVYYPANTPWALLAALLLPTGAAGVAIQAALNLYTYPSHIVAACWASLIAHAALWTTLLVRGARFRVPA